MFLVGTALAAFSRRHIYPVFTVGSEYAVEPGQVYSRFRHQGSQLGNEIHQTLPVSTGHSHSIINKPFLGTAKLT